MSFCSLRDPSSPALDSRTVLATVKPWPGNRGGCLLNAATASLGCSCARRIERTAGRDEETACGRTKKLAEGRYHHGPAVIQPLDRWLRHESLVARPSQLSAWAKSLRAEPTIQGHGEAILATLRTRSTGAEPRPPGGIARLCGNHHAQQDRRSWIGGHGTEPYEQKTQQSPGFG